MSKASTKNSTPQLCEYNNHKQFSTHNSTKLSTAISGEPPKQVLPHNTMNTEIDPAIAHSSIMLVDDSTILRDRLAEAFQERGFRVTVASTCDEAVDKYQRLLSRNV